jgi:GH35 family endo-1,4-beta-xylanase
LTDDFDHYDSFEGINSLIDFKKIGISSNYNLNINDKNVKTGNMAVQITGEIGGSQYSMLNADFFLKKYIGMESVDMSDKLLAVEVFVPVGSPIDYVCFSMIKDGKFVVSGGYLVKQGSWTTIEINMKIVYDYKLWEYKGSLSDAEARDIIKNCQILQVKGQRNTKGNSTNTYIIIDDLKWKKVSESLTDKIAINSNEELLRKYADQKKLVFGTATGVRYIFDKNYSKTLAGNFNMIVPENALKWEVVSPEENEFDFSQSDILMEYALKNNLKFRGHTLFWHMQNPKWILNKKYDDLKSYIDNHIENVMGRYKGKIFAWDVFNEVVKDDGSGLRNRIESDTANYSIWAKNINDSSLIKYAFVKAHQVDPECKLFLNDYSMEEMGKSKSEKFYNFVIDLLKENIPINGVGFQLHLDEGNPPDFNKIRQNVKRYSQLGLEVHFTEIDVRIKTSDLNLSTKSGQDVLQRKLKHQADIYGELLKIALENKNVTAYITWNFTDKYSWIPYFFNGYSNAHIFDRDFNPKPAYDAILAILNK